MNDGERDLTSSQHSCSTKAQSSVTAPFEYKCRTGTARTLEILHPLSAHPWGTDCSCSNSTSNSSSDNNIDNNSNSHKEKQQTYVQSATGQLSLR